MLHWSKEVIPTSLTIIEDKLVLKDAIRNFKNILGWSGDKTVQYPIMVAQEIVAKGIQFEGLRDEIYVQMIKQITNNPSAEGVTQLWSLLQVCVLHFPPTPVFENYLEAWIRIKGGDSRYYIVRTLHETQENGVNQNVPQPETIEAMIKRPYPSTKELIDVHRPNLPPPTAIEEVVAINNKRAVGSPTRPSMKDLAGPPSSVPPPTFHAPAFHAAPPPVQHPPPQQSISPREVPGAARPMPGVPAGARPLPGVAGRGPPPAPY